MLLVGPPQFGWELAFGLRVGKLMQPNIPQAGLFQGVYLSFFMQAVKVALKPTLKKWGLKVEKMFDIIGVELACTVDAIDPAGGFQVREAM